MPNPSVPAGGSATLATTGTTAPQAYTYGTIFSAAGAVLSVREGYSQPPDTTTSWSNGWAVSYDAASPPNVTISAPTSAGGTGLQIALDCYPSGGGSPAVRSAYFDIGAAGPVSYGARTAVNPLWDGSPARGPASRPRAATQPLFAASFLSAAAAHPALVAGEDLLLTATAGRGAAGFARRPESEGLLFSAAARSGRAAPAGTTCPPIAVFEPALVSATPARGILSFALRAAPSGFLTEQGNRTAALFGRRVEETLFSPPGLQFVPPDLLFDPSAMPGDNPVRGVSAARSQFDPPATLFDPSAMPGDNPVRGSAAQPEPGPVVRPAPDPALPDPRDPFPVLRAALLLLLALKGNPMSFAATTLAITDIAAASYRVADLTQMATRLAGLPDKPGVPDKIRGGDGVTSTTYGYGQDQPILKLLPAAEAMIAAAAPDVVLKGIFGPFVSALQGVVSSMGYTSLDAYATARNAAAPYSFLFAPNFALINFLYNSQIGRLLLSPGNVFAPQTLLGIATVGAGATLTYTDLAQIPTTNAVPAPPALAQQGYTPAPGVNALIGAPVNATLTATLTASGWDAGGRPVAGRLWTANLGNQAAGATVSFVPAHAGDRIARITALAGAGAATSGAFNIQTVAERVVT
jgi:hypothetical protein